jgi:hypothetical protein
MSTKDRLLLLWMFLLVMAAFTMTHFARYVVLFIENCFALILGTPRF